MRKGRSENKSRLKRPMKQASGWVKSHKRSIVLGAVIMGLFIAAIFIAVSCTAKSEKAQADQAMKRLNELKVEQEQAQIKWETEKEIEIELRMEEARTQAQAEMAQQMADLNQRLADENKAYEELKQSMDDLMKTYEELMNTVFGPTGVFLDTPMMTEPIFATAALSRAWYDSYFPQGLDPHIDIYLNWKNTYPEGYKNLVKWGRAYTMGDVANYPPLRIDPAMFETCCIAYDSARLRCFLEMYNRKASPFYGREVEVVRYLRQQGRDWYSMIAIMELESTCGMGSSNQFGILDGEFCRGHLEDYVGYLHKWQTRTFGYESNELTKIAQVYNDHAEWRSNFYTLAGDLRTWYP